jgi:hypothetical protein
LKNFAARRWSTRQGHVRRLLDTAAQRPVAAPVRGHAGLRSGRQPLRRKLPKEDRKRGRKSEGFHRLLPHSPGMVRLAPSLAGHLLATDNAKSKRFFQALDSDLAAFCRNAQSLAAGSPSPYQMQ